MIGLSAISRFLCKVLSPEPLIDIPSRRRQVAAAIAGARQ